MNKTYILVYIFLSTLVLTSLVNAQITADYQIIENKVLVEFNFDSVQNLELIIPYNAEALELNIGESDYIIEDWDYFNKLKIDSAENLNIKYGLSLKEFCPCFYFSLHILNFGFDRVCSRINNCSYAEFRRSSQGIIP